MGDVKKDVDALIRAGVSGEDSLRVAFDLDSTIIRIFEQRIRAENPGISKKALLKKIHEDIFYDRKDNP